MYSYTCSIFYRRHGDGAGSNAILQEVGLVSSLIHRNVFRPNSAEFESQDFAPNKTLRDYGNVMTYIQTLGHIWSVTPYSMEMERMHMHGMGPLKFENDVLTNCDTLRCH
jgi:hypothetical protein